MEYAKVCPDCGQPLKRVGPGIAKKTGKPYDAFISCTDRDCNYTAKVEYEKKPAGQPVSKAMNTAESIILETLQTGFKELNTRLDAMESFLTTRLK